MADPSFSRSRFATLRLAHYYFGMSARSIPPSRRATRALAVSLRAVFASHLGRLFLIMASNRMRPTRCGTFSTSSLAYTLTYIPVNPPSCVNIPLLFFSAPVPTRPTIRSPRRRAGYRFRLQRVSGTHRKYGFPPRDRSAPASKILPYTQNDTESAQRAARIHQGEPNWTQYGGRCAEDKISVVFAASTKHRWTARTFKSWILSTRRCVRSPILFLSPTDCFACPRISRLRVPLSDDTPPPIFAVSKRAIRVRCGPRRGHSMRRQQHDRLYCSLDLACSCWAFGHSSATPPRARPQVASLRSRPWCPRRAYPSAAEDSEASSGRPWRLWQRWIALHGGGMRRWPDSDDTYRRGNSIPLLSCRTPSLVTLSRCSSRTWRLSSPLANRYHNAQRAQRLLEKTRNAGSSDDGPLADWIAMRGEDGGGIRGLSMLIILEHLMYKLKVQEIFLLFPTLATILI
ncbi:hypothetical protein B0H14DRAFT_3732257 [Mycena olivaceomarginata]|nr:hypothetical protein B0H14DRAFT_3732257 [Mycena olivaceomarginata]